MNQTVLSSPQHEFMKRPDIKRDVNSLRLPISPRIRFKVFRRDGFRCQYCGRTSEQTTLEIDHIIPISIGGANNHGNLIASCKDCNRGKAAEIIIAPLVEELDYPNDERKKFTLQGMESCQKCNSKNTRKYGTAIVKGGIKVRRRQCKKCGYVYFSELVENSNEPKQ